ncbi:hypothetical protein GBAR_LOCUS7279 [Geodia barretti]|uniref:Uncharacterized protein n=1 Tax=Geodia barretti TaxID=519541 RepID=A0AA35WBK4_GEOBA|nr:hypothetical protein GBAR_LOCUS7279 [Geodia barretti]
MAHTPRGRRRCSRMRLVPVRFRQETPIFADRDRPRLRHERGSAG